VACFWQEMPVIQHRITSLIIGDAVDVQNSHKPKRPHA